MKNNINIEIIEEILERLSRISSPSGYEYIAEAGIKKIIEDYFYGVFDRVYFDKFGGCRLVKLADGEAACKIMFDAHIDQIGLVVTEILDGGFLRVKSLGGLDLNILPASEFYVYTYEESEPFIFSDEPGRKIPAVAVSIPPHLKKTSGNNLPGIEDIYIDTGYDSKEELEKTVRVGSPVVFKPDFLRLGNNLVSCPGLDNKLCAAVLMLAVKSLKDKPGFNFNSEVHIVLSAGEETGELGAATAAFEIEPDFAAALDVEFAKSPKVDAEVSVETGKGPGICYSAASNIKLTKKIIELAKNNNIPLQINAAPEKTSANADIINITGMGIPCVFVCVPLKNMHTPSEVCSLDDIEKAIELAGAIIENSEVLK
ncbi:MAG: M20/M25/M40 family metallo-hydrolase [Oscillospiraceae bacterium]|nr:M20/M25/M40 family metallo-hydrolase [Oscillospiraceae bacterium]